MLGDESDTLETRGTRRERKQRKRREALRMHGASLRRIYRDAILKRLRKQRSESDADGEAGRV